MVCWRTESLCRYTTHHYTPLSSHPFFWLPLLGDFRSSSATKIPWIAALINTNWLVVWNMHFFPTYWEQYSQLTFIFFRGVGLNHQPAKDGQIIASWDPILSSAQIRCFSAARQKPCCSQPPLASSVNAAGGPHLRAPFQGSHSSEQLILVM